MKIIHLIGAIALSITSVGCAPTKPSNPYTDVRDKKNYKTVKIGKQVWMAENLNYEASGSMCYGEGGKELLGYDGNTPIYNTLSKAEIQTNCQKYGRLYNWKTAKTACPKGWRLPRDKDWNVLMKFVNPNCSDNINCDNDETKCSCDDAGAKLKATSGWNSNGNGTDEFGFSALPGGFSHSDGSSANVGNCSSWWSATEDKADKAYNLDMGHEYDTVYMFYNNKDLFFSVRCVQD